MDSSDSKKKLSLSDSSLNLILKDKLLKKIVVNKQELMKGGDAVVSKKKKIPRGHATDKMHSFSVQSTASQSSLQNFHKKISFPFIPEKKKKFVHLV